MAGKLQFLTAAASPLLYSEFFTQIFPKLTMLLLLDLSKCLCILDVTLMPMVGKKHIQSIWGEAIIATLFCFVGTFNSKHLFSCLQPSGSVIVCINVMVPHNIPVDCVFCGNRNAKPSAFMALLR